VLLLEFAGWILRPCPHGAGLGIAGDARLKSLVLHPTSDNLPKSFRPPFARSALHRPMLTER